MFKRELESLYHPDVGVNVIDRPLELNNMSCEGLAEELIFYIKENYPRRAIMVEVSEDGENGAVLTWEP